MQPPSQPLAFHGGPFGALAPFALFLAGVAWLGLSGAPDERGFWPVLLAALGLGLLLARDRKAYADALFDGMSRRLVAVMILAWLLAGVFASLMRASGFVGSLVWGARELGLTGGAFVAAAFLIASLVSTSTGTSLGTLILCVPLLYPAGGELAAEPAVLLGALLAGATFGDNISPVSDTTIASATTQGADLGGVVRSRLRYALPAAAVALGLFLYFGGAATAGTAPATAGETASPAGLPMLAAPVLVFGLLLARRHLLEGLFAGIAAALAVGLGLGRIAPHEVLAIDAERFAAVGLIVDGMERAVGISIFTLLLVGLVAVLEATGLTGRLVERSLGRARTARGAEIWTFAAVSGAVLATTHSVVAILAVGPFARQAGERFGLSPYRRANLLDLTVCTYPFLVPYSIPTVLAASATAGAAGMPRLTPLAAGLFNFHSWALLAVTLLAILTGFGRERG